jgi:hypothetical protein
VHESAIDDREYVMVNNPTDRKHRHVRVRREGGLLTDFASPDGARDVLDIWDRFAVDAAFFDAGATRVQLAACID